VNQSTIRLVHRLVTDVFERGDLEFLEQLYQPVFAGQASAWIAPFLASLSGLPDLSALRQALKRRADRA
jgi:hypothetical protein